MPNDATKRRRFSQIFDSVGRAFLKKHSQVIYAVILIILIPLVIIGNSVFIINRFFTDTNFQLQRQALIIAEVFDATAFDSLDDIDSVQEKISRMLTGAEELRSFDIIVPEGMGFKTIASSFASNIDKEYQGYNALIAWSTDRGVAHLAKPTLEEVQQNPGFADQRYWNVIFPLHDADGDKIALLNLKMSIKVTDDLARKTLIGSSLLLILTLVIVLGLLILNTKLFQYAILFKKLEEVDQMKDEFISMASHELRTPITAIRGYVSMFIDGSFGTMTDAGKKGLEIVNSSIRRLADLVEDLLNVSRIEQNRLQLSTEKVNMREAITQTIDELKITATSKKLSLNYEDDPNLPFVRADKDKLRQILVNIIGNAIKYTREGSVTVSAKQQENIVIVKVKDTGIGMSAKDREKLFEKFYRVTSESTKGITGTGLGLWITKQLVNLMGGEIFVDSIEGVGTEMSFTVPIFDETKK